MRIQTVAIDLAKTVFELAAAVRTGKMPASSAKSAAAPGLFRKPLRRSYCHGGLRDSPSLGAIVRQPRHACIAAAATLCRAYVRRNKTDSADATALLEASRASDITPVQVKSLDQQGLQGMHRIRSRLEIDLHGKD